MSPLTLQELMSMEIKKICLNLIFRLMPKALNLSNEPVQ